MLDKPVPTQTFIQSTLGQDSTWMGDCLGTPDAGSVGSDIDAF